MGRIWEVGIRFDYLLLLILLRCPTLASTLSRYIKDKVAPACQKQLFKVQKDAAEDFRSDTQVWTGRSAVRTMPSESQK